MNRLSTIETSLSPQTLRYKPGGPPADLDITVVNGSERFATFLINVDAPAVDDAVDFRWYQLSPEIGTKIPPGDRTQFRVSIFSNPVPGFVGTMNLTVRVLSLELQDEERQLVRLVIEQGLEAAPLELELPVQQFSVHPGETFEIPVGLYNPSQVPVEAVLKVSGLPVDWGMTPSSPLPRLAANEHIDTFLQCQVPPLAQVVSQAYGFAIAALQPNGLTSTVAGTIQVLPEGHFEAHFDPLEQDVPDVEGDRRTAVFGVRVENLSNLAEQVSLTVQPGSLPAAALHLPDPVPLLPGTTAQLPLAVTPGQPLLGPPRRYALEVAAQLSQSQLDLRNESQTLTLWVKPQIPFLLQIAGGMLLALLLLLPFLIRPSGHTGPVTDLALSGDADRVVSGSSDQTLRRWRIEGQRLQADGVLARLDKAVRVVSLRPVGNNIVAVGLENGEISLWDLLSSRQQPLQTLVDNKANRVLSLEFTPDATYLFSSHGSGAVLQWAVGADLAGTSDRSRPVRDKAFDFAVYDLAPVGEQGQQLAVAGRYNRLLLWNWQTDATYTLGDQAGSQNDYIQSLAVPDFKPQRLAVADNQGRIRLWDLSPCLPVAKDDCETLLDEWQGHGDRPVRSLAFSADGCYLVSTGDDRKVLLWPLGLDGRRVARWQNGKRVRQGQQKLNTVGIVLTADRILVSSGGDDHRVRLDALRRSDLQKGDQGACDAQ